MENQGILRIGIVGSGNVATHLAKAISLSKHHLIQVLSRNIDHAKRLTNNTNAEAIDKPKLLKSELDILILALKDEALHSNLISQFPRDTIICHTSGSVSMQPFIGFPEHGIFYPLQTFSKQKEVDFNEIPICLEANSEAVLQKIHSLASSISKHVYEINSQQRKALHLAAVFACNFTNLMYNISEKLSRESGLDFEILRPLIKETAAKVQEHLPAEVQTGPAVRNDNLILNKHLKLLENHKDYQDIYRILTNEIKTTNEKL
jgi:predicted short-subunit dehydrogenase-like oxidoreductase (DUF2520 family)